MIQHRSFAFVWMILLSAICPQFSCAFVSCEAAGSIPKDAAQFALVNRFQKKETLGILYALSQKGALHVYRIGSRGNAISFSPLNRLLAPGEVVSQFAVLPTKNIAYLVYDSPKGVFLEAAHVNADGQFVPGKETSSNKIKITIGDRISNLILDPQGRVLYLVSSYGVYGPSR